MRYFDTHSHLNFSQFDSDRDQVIAKMKDLGVATNTVGVNQKTSQIACDLAEKYPNLYAIVGQHPVYWNDEIFDTGLYKKLIQKQKTVGIGECGFDFFREGSRDQVLQQQESLFRKQIELAIEYNKPLMLHIRPTPGTFDAYEDVLRILDLYSEKKNILQGQTHFFAGNRSILDNFIDRGFYISFTGVVTFTYEYDDLVRAVPADRLLIETDAPYVAPVPFRGERCLPQYVIDIYSKIAEIRSQEIELLRIQCLQNAKNLYNFSTR